MSRLLSFQGPSTPSRDHATPPEKSPSRGGNTPNKSNRSARPKKSAGRGRDPIGSTNAPLGATGSSPKEEEASFVETEIHKTLRKTLLGIRKASREWDETVRGGFQAAKDMVDARTTIQNALSVLPPGQVHHRPVVGPNMAVLNDSMAALEEMLNQLQRLFDTLAGLIDALETLHLSAVNGFHGLTSSGRSTDESESRLDPDAPLYPTTTWSLSRFCTAIPPLITPFYHRQLESLRAVVAELRQNDVEWERSRSLLAVWKEGGPNLADFSGCSSGTSTIDGWLMMDPGWSDDVEEVCAIEVMGWKPMPRLDA